MKARAVFQVPPGTRYEDVDAVNPSSLKKMLISPLHYKHGLTAPHKETPQMRLGTAVHAAILQPDVWLSNYIAKPDGMSFATVEGKAWRAANRDRIILDADDFAKVERMADAVLSSRVARPYIGDGKVEQPIYWTDPDTGINCKGRPDLLTRGGILSDLKTAADLDRRKFIARACEFGYPFSMAMYRDGLELIGTAPTETVLVVVESSEPHDVAVYMLDGEPLEFGREQYRMCLDRLAGCRMSGEWHGRAPEPVQFDVPAWAYPDVERAANNYDDETEDGYDE